jgi:hypothetical protein
MRCKSFIIEVSRLLRRNLKSLRTPEGRGPRIDRDRSALKIPHNRSEQANFLRQ